MYTNTIITTPLVLLLAMTIGAASQKQLLPGACCFSLLDSSTNGAIQQQKSQGYLAVGGNSPEAWLCTDLFNGRQELRDVANSACFVNPDKVVQCSDVAPGFTLFTLQNSPGGGVRVAADGNPNFSACGGANGNLIHVASQSGCRGLELKAVGLQGKCGDFKG
ncbi:hypothetical protein AAL_01013 [Moelleriella libera RCEF 2490]|uniref:Cyanovirin-N domain-containing protein n=1 Tax=Moelleriella libera RCEF 2490 TaxID=1081109 RepID=A0A166VDQ6_9HYPO|nr:hypothetical protein AAL_01013 [Moelleriella libera RCEF 2490]